MNPGRQLLDLLRLRGGPQDWPYSPNLLFGLVALAILIDALIASAAPTETLPAVARVALIGIVLLGLPFLVLRAAKRSARFVQTASALVATHLIFAVLVYPLLLAIGKLPEAGDAVTAGQALLAWVALALLAWKLAVHGNVFRHALEVPLSRGVLVAGALLIAEAVLTALVLAVFVQTP